MTLIKGMLLGGLLTWVVALVLGSNGSSGAYLNIHAMKVHTFEVYWSWPLFIVSSGGAWGILTMMK